MPGQSLAGSGRLQRRLNRLPAGSSLRFDGTRGAKSENPCQYLCDATVSLAAGALRWGSDQGPSASADTGFDVHAIQESLTRFQPRPDARAETSRRSPPPFQRQPDCEGAARPQRALNRDPTAVEVNEILGDGEPQPDSLLFQLIAV